jgi:hypothetical protein
MFGYTQREGVCGILFYLGMKKTYMVNKIVRMGALNCFEE